MFFQLGCSGHARFVESADTRHVDRIVGFSQSLIGCDRVRHLVGLIRLRPAAGVTLDRARPPHVRELAFIGFDEGLAQIPEIVAKRIRRQRLPDRAPRSIGQPRFTSGEDLEMIDVAWQRAGVDVHPDCLHRITLYFLAVLLCRARFGRP